MKSSLKIRSLTCGCFTLSEDFFSPTVGGREIDASVIVVVVVVVVVVVIVVGLTGRTKRPLDSNLIDAF